MSEPLRDRLRAALPAALKARDRATASTLRATLAAIENAEAVDTGPVRAGAIEASAVGIGAMEAERRVLTEADVVAIVRAEIAERGRAAEVYETDRVDFAEAYLVACAETTGVGRVASFDRSIDRVETIERIEPPPI